MAAAVSSAVTGQPADADRWAHRVGRWQSQDVARPNDPAAEARAALLRALRCRHGLEQMRADADEAAEVHSGGHRDADTRALARDRLCAL